MKGWERTVYCGAVRAAQVGQVVTLNGWVERRRDLGGLIFVHVRDREGVVQAVFNPEGHAAAHGVAEAMRSEFVVAIRGEVHVEFVAHVDRFHGTGLLMKSQVRDVVTRIVGQFHYWFLLPQKYLTTTVSTSQPSSGTAITSSCLVR